MQEEDLCQAFSDVLLHNVEDIDADDSGNPQLCSDYVKDIYLYLRQLEVWHTESVLLQWSVNFVAHAALSLNSCSNLCAHITSMGRRSMDVCVQF